MFTTSPGGDGRIKGVEKGTGAFIDESGVPRAQSKGGKGVRNLIDELVRSFDKQSPMGRPLRPAPGGYVESTIRPRGAEKVSGTLLTNRCEV